MEDKIRVIVAGGGTAGWLTAYSLAKRLGNSLDITPLQNSEHWLICCKMAVAEGTVPVSIRVFPDE